MIFLKEKRKKEKFIREMKEQDEQKKKVEFNYQ